MVAKMRDNGWTAVVYNRRGHRDKAGIRSDVDEVVEAEVGELACEVASPRAPEAEQMPDAAAAVGLPSPDKRKRPWPIYSDLEDMHEVRRRAVSSFIYYC